MLMSPSTTIASVLVIAIVTLSGNAHAIMRRHSGGPALIATAEGLAVAGVSSWQDARRRKIGTYGVHDFYARVSSDLEFIDEITAAGFVIIVVRPRRT